MNDNKILKAEDYEEPNCILINDSNDHKQAIEMIPQQRIQIKLDELMGKKEFEQAERHLKYWLEEAISNHDKQGEFFIYNEMMGYYRKVNKPNEGYEVIDKALNMLEELDYIDTISGGTCFVNAATVYATFENYDKALELFEKAKLIYENHKDNNGFKLAGLYNNMSTSLVATNRFKEAEEYYDKAIGLLKKEENAKIELGMIYINKIDIILSEKGMDVIDERIDEYLNKAKDCFEDEEVIRDTYYSFMISKCINVYDYFGWFNYSKILKERINEIDERAKAS